MSRVSWVLATVAALLVVSPLAVMGRLSAPRTGVFTAPLVPRAGAAQEQMRRLRARRLTGERMRRLAATNLPINGSFIELSATYWVPQYAFPISAGTPSQVFHVVPDSGSNYVGLPAGITQTGFMNQAHQFNPQDSSSFTADTKLTGNIDLQYGGGGLIGPGGYDTFGVGSMMAKDQGFIVVKHVSGTSFIGSTVYWEGIWGLCFQGLYHNASNKFGAPAFYKPLLQTLFEQGQLASPSFGFYLASDPQSASAGAIQFGAPDTSKFTGDLHYVDVYPMHPNRTEPGNQYGYWLLGVDGVSIDGRNISVCEQNSCIAFVDTGGPLLNVPLAVAEQIVPYVHINSNCSGLDENPTLSLNLGGKDFPLTPEDYVYKLTDETTGVTTCELGINVLPGATNYMFQIGDTFLRKYYTYFVAGETTFADHPKLGFATAVHA